MEFQPNSKDRATQDLPLKEPVAIRPLSPAPSAKSTDHPQAQSFRKQDWPFYWITRVSNRYIQTLEMRLKRIGQDVPSYRVLMCLHEDDQLSVSEIAEFSIIKLNTATKIIQRMAAQGLVVTRQRPDDLRVTEVSLTDEGEQRRRAAREVAASIYAEAFEELTPDEEKQLNALMEKLFNRMGQL